MIYNLLDFGAIGDGITLNTNAIQRAIDACNENGGGKVIVPKGVYKTGTIWLKSHVELHLEQGAELLASSDINDYNDLDAYPQNSSSEIEKWVGKHLIIALEVQNVALTGLGMINGNCHAFVDKIDSPKGIPYGWWRGKSLPKDLSVLRPGQMVCFIECKFVKVEKITMVDSPCWSCFFHGCEHVSVDGVKIFNPIWVLNTDGIDIDSSRFVTVSNCHIETGDDAITLRANERRLKNKQIHCENVSITNCTLSTGICAFRIGVGYGSINNARISNIKVELAQNLVQFCTAYCKKGCANIEDITISNVTATNTDRCVEAFADNGATIKNVLIEDINTTSVMRNYINCIEGEIDNFTLKNVNIDFSSREEEHNEEGLATRGDSLLMVKDAKKVSLDNVKLNGEFKGITKRTEFTNCENLNIKDCNF